MDAPRGLLIDFGGVLTTPLRDAFVRWSQREGVDYERLRALLHTSYPVTDPDSIVIQVETGRMPVEEFERCLAEVLSRDLHHPIPADGLLDRMGETLELEERMVEAVRRSHALGVRTGLLSNSWGLSYYPTDLLAELFDEIVISGEVGMRKPDEDIYLHAAGGLGLAPGECVFVDDLEVNIETAKRVGMRTIHHESPDVTIPVLERLFGRGLDTR